MPTRCGHPTKSDVEAIEKNAKRTTKLVSALKNSYIDRLIHLGLPTFNYRR